MFSLTFPFSSFKPCQIYLSVVGCEINPGNAAFTCVNNSTEDNGISHGSKQWPTLCFYSTFYSSLWEVLSVGCELLSPVFTEMCCSEL